MNIAEIKSAINKLNDEYELSLNNTIAIQKESPFGFRFSPLDRLIERHCYKHQDSLADKTLIDEEHNLIFNINVNTSDGVYAYAEKRFNVGKSSAFELRIFFYKNFKVTLKFDIYNDKNSLPTDIDSFTFSNDFNSNINSFLSKKNDFLDIIKRKEHLDIEGNNRLKRAISIKISAIEYVRDNFEFLEEV